MSKKGIITNLIIIAAAVGDYVYPSGGTHHSLLLVRFVIQVEKP